MVFDFRKQQTPLFLIKSVSTDPKHHEYQSKFLPVGDGSSAHVQLIIELVLVLGHLSHKNLVSLRSWKRSRSATAICLWLKWRLFILLPSLQSALPVINLGRIVIKFIDWNFWEWSSTFLKVFNELDCLIFREQWLLNFSCSWRQKWVIFLASTTSREQKLRAYIDTLILRNVWKLEIFLGSAIKWYTILNAWILGHL